MMMRKPHRIIFFFTACVYILDESTTTMAKNVLFALIWILLLVFIAWPVAFFCAGIWVFLQVSHEQWSSIHADGRRHVSMSLHIPRCPGKSLTNLVLDIYTPDIAL